MTTHKLYSWGSGARLRMTRLYLGLTIKEIGSLLSVAPRTVTRWEHGDDPIPSPLWEELDDVIGRSREAESELLDTLSQLDDDQFTVVVCESPRTPGEVAYNAAVMRLMPLLTAGAVVPLFEADKDAGETFIVTTITDDGTYQEQEVTYDHPPAESEGLCRADRG